MEDGVAEYTSLLDGGQFKAMALAVHPDCIALRQRTQPSLCIGPHGGDAVVWHTRGESVVQVHAALQGEALPGVALRVEGFEPGLHILDPIFRIPSAKVFMAESMPRRKVCCMAINPGLSFGMGEGYDGAKRPTTFPADDADQHARRVVTQ